MAPPVASTAFSDLLERLAVEHGKVVAEMERLRHERHAWLERMRKLRIDQMRSGPIVVTNTDSQGSSVSNDVIAQGDGSSDTDRQQRARNGQSEKNGQTELNVQLNTTVINVDSLGDLMPVISFDSHSSSMGDDESTMLSNAKKTEVVLPRMDDIVELESRPGSRISHGNLSQHNVSLPDELELWPEWRESSPRAQPSVSIRSSNRTGDDSTTQHFEQPPGMHLRGGDKVSSSCTMFVASPSSPRRLFWDFLGAIVLCYDLLTVPLIAFNRNSHEPPLKEALDFSTTVYWIVDIPLQFFSGYHSGGFIEMRPKKIAKRYIRGWFIPDLLIVVLDLSMLLLQSNLVRVVDFSRIAKIVRAFRVLRLLRVMRVMKWPSWAEDIRYSFHSEALQTAIGAFSTLFAVVAVNHFIACGWYWVGTLKVDGNSWVDDLDHSGEHSVSDPYHYATALHWSLSQFTPATMAIGPTNLIERVYAIGVVLFAMVIFSQFVSSITAALATLRHVNKMSTRERIYVQKYIEENHLSMDLSGRIMAFLSSRKLMGRRRVHEDDIKMFKALPEKLLLQVHWEVFGPRVMPHPFFHHIHLGDDMAIFDICHRAMSERPQSASQDLFTPGQEAKHMFFTVSGIWEYFRSWTDRQPLELDGHAQEYWFCEMVLWLKWEHRGRLAASNDCECVALDAAKFRLILCRKPTLYLMGHHYARMYKLRVIEVLDEHDELVEVLPPAFDWTKEASQQCYEYAYGEVSPTSDEARPPWQLIRSFSPHFGLLKKLSTSLSPRRGRGNTV